MIIYSSLCIKNECSFSKSNSHFFFWGVETWIWIVELNVEVGGLEFSLLGFGLPGLSSRFRQWLWARWIFGCHLIIAAEVISPDSSKNEVLFAAWCDVTYCLASPHPCCVLKKLFLKYGKLLALAWLKKDSRMSLWVRIILDWTDWRHESERTWVKKNKMQIPRLGIVRVIHEQPMLQNDLQRKMVGKKKESVFCNTWMHKIFYI